MAERAYVEGEIDGAVTAAKRECERPASRGLGYDFLRLYAQFGRVEKERDALRDKLLEIAKSNCGSFQHDIPAFLAGLSTGTPECERVSVRPHTPGDETDHICARHGCAWPSDTKRCPAAGTEDVTR